MDYFLQILLNGTHNGTLYALLAYGYVLTYQVTHRANFAHGAIFAFSGQNLILFTVFGWNTLWLTLPLALLFGMAMASALSIIALILLAKVVFPPLIEKSPNTMVAATLGVSIFLMELARLGADTRDYWLPQIFAAPIHFTDSFQVSLTQIQVFNIVGIAVFLLASEMILSRSRVGRDIRAVSDDPLAAELVGVSRSSVTAGAVIVGGSYAILTGFLAAIYFGNIGFGTGLVFGLKVLFIAAAGGFSIPRHAAAGAFLVGLAEAIWDGYFPTIYRDPVIYLTLAFLLAMRTETSNVGRLT